MSTQTQTHTPTNVNAGILAMRAANAARALGLAPRPGSETPPAPPKARKAAPKAAPAEPETPESQRTFRVCVLVDTPTGITHVNVQTDAAGPRRAGKQARAQALQSGHSPVGICAIATEDAPSAIWAALAPA